MAANLQRHEKRTAQRLAMHEPLMLLLLCVGTVSPIRSGHAHMQGTYLSRRKALAPTTREAEIQQLRCLSLCKGKHREA